MLIFFILTIFDINYVSLYVFCDTEGKVAKVDIFRLIFFLLCLR